MRWETRRFQVALVAAGVRHGQEFVRFFEFAIPPPSIRTKRLIPRGYSVYVVENAVPVNHPRKHGPEYDNNNLHEAPLFGPQRRVVR